MAQHDPNVAKQCPHCGQWALKDAACNYVFACGLAVEGFVAGCARPWCWECGKKFCGVWPSGPTSHGDNCCAREVGFRAVDYCPGGHNSHCERGELFGALVTFTTINQSQDHQDNSATAAPVNAE